MEIYKDVILITQPLKIKCFFYIDSQIKHGKSVAKEAVIEIQACCVQNGV